MSKKRKEVNIPSWHAFAARSVSLEFHKVDDTFQGAVTFFLDDGEEIESEEDQKVVTIYLDFFTDQPKDDALAFAGMFSSFFENIHSHIFVFEDDKILHQYDLQLLAKQQAAGIKKVANVTFH